MKTTRSGELVNADGSPWDGESKPHSKATGLPVQTALLDQVTTRQGRTPTTRETNETPEAVRARRERLRQSGDNVSGNLFHLSQEAQEIEGKPGGRLNPRWVEWLMGFPIGWTSLDPLPADAMERWADPEWWAIDPADVGEIPRVSEKEPNRAAQLKALGNAQVPLCAATAWQILAADY